MNSSSDKGITNNPNVLSNELDQAPKNGDYYYNNTLAIMKVLGRFGENDRSIGEYEMGISEAENYLKKRQERIDSYPLKDIKEIDTTNHTCGRNLSDILEEELYKGCTEILEKKSFDNLKISKFNFNGIDIYIDYKKIFEYDKKELFSIEKDILKENPEESIARKINEYIQVLLDDFSKTRSAKNILS